MAKKLPAQLRFLLADAVREEAGGKVSILGFYSGDEVVLQGELPTKLEEGAQAVALPALTILVLFVDGYGNFQLRLQVFDPTGKPFGLSKPMQINKVKGAPYNIILPIMPFPIRVFGRYRFELRIDKRKYEYSFTVRHQDPNVRLPTPPTTITSKRKVSPPKRVQGKKNALAGPLDKRKLK